MRMIAFLNSCVTFYNCIIAFRSSCVTALHEGRHSPSFSSKRCQSTCVAGFHVLACTCPDISQLISGYVKWLEQWRVLSCVGIPPLTMKNMLAHWRYGEVEGCKGDRVVAVVQYKRWRYPAGCRWRWRIDLESVQFSEESLLHTIWYALIMLHRRKGLTPWHYPGPNYVTGMGVQHICAQGTLVAFTRTSTILNDDSPSHRNHARN